VSTVLRNSRSRTKYTYNINVLRTQTMKLGLVMPEFAAKNAESGPEKLEEIQTAKE